MGYLFYSYTDRHFRVGWLLWVASILFIFAGCDEGSYSSTEEGGSVAFQLQWMDGDGVGTDSSAKIEASDCDKASVSTVSAILYNGQDKATDKGSWPFENREGRFSDVPLGPNNTIVVMGNGPACGVVFRGIRGDLDIVAGQTTDAGLIEMYRFVPASETLSYNIDTEMVSWESVEGARFYQFQATAAADVNFENPIFDESLSSESTSRFLSKNKNFLWRVRVRDRFGIDGAWSNSVYTLLM